MVMDPSHPTSVEAQEKAQAAAAREAKEATTPDAPIANLKSKQDQMTYLLEATLRIERSLANLAKNQESLERIVEDKMYNLDVKVTEIQSIVDKLRDDAEDGNEDTTTERYQAVPRAPRSSAMPIADTRPTHSAPATTTSLPPPVSTPPAQQKSAEAFMKAILSMPYTHTGATSQKTPSGAPGDRA